MTKRSGSIAAFDLRQYVVRLARVYEKPVTTLLAYVGDLLALHLKAPGIPRILHRSHFVRRSKSE